MGRAGNPRQILDLRGTGRPCYPGGGILVLFLHHICSSASSRRYVHRFVSTNIRKENMVCMGQ
jgi:hypothetical protein